jgi:hypothetical protein
MEKSEKVKNHIQKIKKKLEQTPENIFRSPLQPEDKLIALEIEKEFDVFEKTWENRVFVKLFVAARTSGLLKKMSDREFKTLIALALYMDENGDCFPSQDQIARDLGCSRETANRRIQSLLRFRFNGEPVVHSLKTRNKEGKWDNVRYTILPVAQIKIFEKPSKEEIETSHVTKSSHGPCDDVAMWQNRHTNKNHNKLNQILNNVNNADKKIPLKENEEQEYLAQELAERLDDDSSLGFYRRVVGLVPKHVVFQALSEVKDAYLTGRVRKSKGALFNSVIQSKAKECGIDLNLKREVK